MFEEEASLQKGAFEGEGLTFRHIQNGLFSFFRYLPVNADHWHLSALWWTAAFDEQSWFYCSSLLSF